MSKNPKSVMKVGPHTFAAPVSVDRMHQKIYARSRTSGESQSFVAVLRIRWTKPWDESDL